MSYRSVKRAIDFLASIIFLILLSPVLLVTAVAILISSGRPIFFRQTRIGIDKKPFVILKFRTMAVDDNRTVGQTFSDSDGVTVVGKFLRRSKIDELPQLISVLNGDMSIVGPRPCMPTLLPEIDDASMHRFSIRPGITGLAQVKGNVKLSWPERWGYDIEYVDNYSFALDVSILFKTLSVIIFGERKSNEV